MDPRRPPRREVKAAGAVALVGVLAACPGSDPVMPAAYELASSGEEAAQILLLDDLPQPGYLEVEAGTPVEWRNAGSHEHSVSTYGTPDEWQDTLLKPGETFSHTFQQPGEYAYICVVHHEVGSVMVVEATSGLLYGDGGGDTDMEP